ncbi:short chain dehydrogenase/reductase family [Aspergillus karnatakaensis]|uniref:SDR family NAD(P)-dependent oxidoreductase n=1 Tax=Aspergillus karnatakaensis TaxID=1810916 RepID=UPI003CCC965B
MSSFDITTLFSVNGLVAVITGGGSGLGRTIAHALAENGASKVYILGRRLSALEETASKYPETIIPIVADVASKDTLIDAAARIRTETGYVNLLVAAAGIVYSAQQRSSNTGTESGVSTGSNGQIQVGRVLTPNATASDVESFLLDTPEDEFLDSYRVNTMGVFYTVAAFVSLLDEGNKRGNVSQKSQVIALASVAGQSRYATGGCAYGMSKAAVMHCMRQMMTLLAPVDVRVNTVSPGFFPSELAGGLPNYGLTVEGSFARDVIPLRRAGTHEEAAGTFLYLASKAGGFVHGQVLVVDGGRLGYL